MRLVELRDGQAFSGIYALKTATHYPDGDSPRLALTLGDSTGSRKGVIWKPQPKVVQAMLVAEAVKVSGRVNPPGRYAGELAVEQIDVVEVTPELLDALLPSFLDSHDADVDKLDALIETVTHPLCKKLLLTFCMDPSGRFSSMQSQRAMSITLTGVDCFSTRWKSPTFVMRVVHASHA
jgi:hypothetical protein